MAPEYYSASAPGSVMLLGEHSVLTFGRALISAINKRIYVNIQFITKKTIVIISRFGKEELDFCVFDKLDINKQDKHQYVKAVLLQYWSAIQTENHGMIIKIEHEFDSIGLGSSSALICALSAVFEAMFFACYDKKIVYRKAKAAVVSVQKVASGADLLASINGGVIFIDNIFDDYVITHLPSNLKLIALYSGDKVPTERVLEYLAIRRKIYGKIEDAILLALDTGVLQGVEFLKQNDLAKLGEVFNIQHKLLDALKVSNAKLNDLTQLLLAGGSYGAKLSGAGMGDCVIGLYESAADIKISHDAAIKLNIANTGIMYGEDARISTA